VKVSKELPLDTLAPLGCGIMTGAGGMSSQRNPCFVQYSALNKDITAMLNVAQAEKRDSVVIVGSGAVGLAALMSLKILPKPPTTVIAVDIVPSRLELAKSRGATHTINSKETPDLKGELMKITNGAGVEAGIDTTGRPDIVETLLKSLAKKGVVVTVGVGKVCRNPRLWCLYLDCG
jgi:aryl-alcohol dehydrogenase